MEGIVSASELYRGRPSASQSFKPTSQQDRDVAGSLSSASVLLANFSNEALTISKATVLGVAEEVSVSLIDRINAKGESNMNMATKPTRKKRDRFGMINYYTEN
jgi:hypothetical protein